MKTLSKKVQLLSRLLCLILAATCLFPPHSVKADPAIPPVWDVVTEDFESGSLAAWNLDNPGGLTLVPGAGINGSIGFSVSVSQTYSDIYQNDVSKSVEGYLTFWINPNNVDIPDPYTTWPPANALCVTQIVSSINEHWHPLVSLYIRKPSGQGYKGFMAWQNVSGNFYDYENGQFDLVNGWQKITLGYHINTWVGVWVNDVLVRYSTNVQHVGLYGDVIALGQVESNSQITPIGSILFDNILFQVPRVGDLWVDAINGNDTNDGLSRSSSFRTIQKAADIAGPGTTVHILPGIYRETVWPALNGNNEEPEVYRAENGPGTVMLRGSEPSSSLVWTQLTTDTIGLPPGVDPSNIYYTDLSTWNLNGPPRFLTVMDTNNQVTDQLPLAREPDWQVTSEWKYHENWWAADGGSSPAACDPVTNSDHNCDSPQRSTTDLTDITNDTEPAGIETGNLTTLGDLTGATVVAMDTVEGTYSYRRKIIAHDVDNGRITVDSPCEFDGSPGLGWGSKYYVEGKSRLLDNAGEWWYDSNSGKIYLWPLSPGNPASMNIEISQRANGFSLKNRSYITLDGLVIEFYNDNAVYEVNGLTQRSNNNIIRNMTLRYANTGVNIEQQVNANMPFSNVIDGFTVEDSEIAYMDTHGVRLIDIWENNSAPESFTHSGVLNTMIRNNEFHHLGFRSDSDNPEGLIFVYADKLRFESNNVHDVAHNGVQFSESVIQSPNSYGFPPSEIKTGDILIVNNIFERTCQLTTDCGGLKIWGKPPSNHVFRDVLISGNIFRNIFGWSYISEKRARWYDNVNITGGFGLYLDYASGIHAYRNISYNNAYTDYMMYGTWRDGDIVYYNNIAANSLFGFSMGGPQFDTHGNVNTQIVDNMLVNNEGYGIWFSAANNNYTNITFNHNLYFNNGWRPYEDGGVWKPGDMSISNGVSSLYYQTLSEIQNNTTWEIQGVEGDPKFWNYDVDDYDPHDNSWPIFQLTTDSVNVIDQGVQELPQSLADLITLFNIEDSHWGPAFDIGRYESGFTLIADSATQMIQPGGTAYFHLNVLPSDLPYSVTLTAENPSPDDLLVEIDPNNITPEMSAIFTVKNRGTDTLQTGIWYTIGINGNGGGFIRTMSVNVLVGGSRVYLPLLTKK